MDDQLLKGKEKGSQRRACSIKTSGACEEYERPHECCMTWRRAANCRGGGEGRLQMLYSVECRRICNRLLLQQSVACSELCA